MRVPLASLWHCPKDTLVAAGGTLRKCFPLTGGRSAPAWVCRDRPRPGVGR